ncbi:acyl-CoA dehydrogenase [Nitratireductor aestuarii]|uniref:Acyl-CoA dehydrogenase n=1 Tax=Nitratireductor aestuarii TaxID=1735103 RepID=A0A916RYH6_9HYPH|nr:acyl-CoA dehydrogenase family protein [Nitratireductor aestuarii]GGA76853.1 acyl-CoA dehydrogenase [Nitratireductor aestuarii]
MEFEALARTPEQIAVRDAVKAICNRFDDAYWRERDRTGTFPHEFTKAMAEGGWLGIAMPQEYGGAGLGVTEAAIMMQVVGNSAGAFAACSSIHINIFGPHAIVVHGTPEQKERMLRPLIEGKIRACFGVTEPDAGLDTTKLKTRAVLKGDRYIVHGRKMWISTAQIADKIMLIARTTPIEECKRPTDGLTIFFTDFDRSKIEAREVHKMGRAAVDSNALFIDGLEIPVEDRIGEEGRGFYYLLDSLNPERILNAAEVIGIGRRALAKATQYAKDRVVFGRPIGMNQSIQHPLAESWSELMAAELMTLRAAELYDAGQPCGAEANAAKYLAADANFHACDRAVRTHGGMGYASEFDVERYFREAVGTRLAPVSRELVLCYLAERVLGLPKSY